MAKSPRRSSGFLQGTLGKDPLRHYVPLWMLVVVNFVLIMVYVVGGQQQHLATTRRFDDVSLDGDLTVDGTIIDTPLQVGPTAIPTAPATTAIAGTLTQPANTYLSGLTILVTGAALTVAAAGGANANTATVQFAPAGGNAIGTAGNLVRNAAGQPANLSLIHI